jgi:hypothetical protein
VPAISAPLFAIDKDKIFLHQSTCQLEGIEHTFVSGHRHRCSFAHGSSGGALISRNSQKIVAIITSHKIFYGIATPRDSLLGCFSKQGTIDLTLSGCKLEKPCSFSVSEKSPDSCLNQFEESPKNNC